MKAFLTGIALMLAVTVVAAIGFNFTNSSSKQVYQDRPNVRL
jgi:outer membrane lipopolysaccharide assembly protein LptE/RlpB